MGGYGTDFSYLHQGLDIITPIGEHTFAVADGIVKCVLTLGGDIYWRIAVSPEQQDGYSSGWLYAHLIESTIQYDVGDTVRVFDYLGDIIRWYDDWGHIHFVEITDSGRVWQYDDNEWGINFNPLLALEPLTDTRAPIIEDVFRNQKFAFCLNETSDYLDPDSLFGEFDIIAKIVDFVGGSDWQQPAYETFYWVKSENDSIVFPRTLGQRLNHPFPFYNSESYEPFATLFYKRDFRLVPTSWMRKNRNFYHILTNNNGDSLASLSEKDLAFNSTKLPDGNYQIFVEARDVSGNSTVDSMQVQFKNKIVSQVENLTPEIHQNARLRIFPNPFNATTRIEYFLPQSATIQIHIFDVLGRQLQNMTTKKQTAGIHRVPFNGINLASGIYWIRLQTPGQILVEKMVLLR